MNFQVKTSEKDVYLTVALEGSLYNRLRVKDSNINEMKWRTGKAKTFLLEDIIEENNIVRIETEGNIGDYLTLSVHIVKKENFEGIADESFLVPNGPEITSYLENNIIKVEFFPIDFSNSRYNLMNQLYITGRIHTKYILVYLIDENMY